MEQDVLIATVYQEIDILIKEKNSIINYIAEIEHRRKRYVVFIRNSDALVISNEERRNLIGYVSDMELNLRRKANAIKDEVIEKEKRESADMITKVTVNTQTNV